MKVDIASITVDQRLQSRAAMNDEAVFDYAERIKAGTKFDPVMCFEDGDVLWLVEGFHRVAAHRMAGENAIDVECRPGTFREAWVYSLGTNDKHGVRRTNADKRKAVESALTDDELSKWSVRELAAHCSVSHSFVDKVKHELKVSIVDTCEKSLEVQQQISPPAGESDGTGTAEAPAGGEPESAAQSPGSATAGGENSALSKTAAADTEPSAGELDELEAHMAEARDNLALLLLDSDDPMQAVAQKNLDLEHQVFALRSEITRLMNENAAAIKQIKALKGRVRK